MLQGKDQIKIYNPKDETFYLSSIRRIRNQRTENLDSSSSHLTLIIESIEEKQQKNVSTIRLDGNKTFRIVNEMFKSRQIFVTKDGIDDMQLFFVSDEANPHVFFTFYATSEQDIININSIQNDQNLANENISIEIYKAVTNELIRINKSPNQLLLICLILHTFFPFSAFSRINLKRIDKIDCWIVLEKILYVYYNKIRKEDVLEEFKKCIDYLDFQITIDNELSFGTAFFIITFLRFFNHQIFNLTKLFFFKKNFIIFLALLTFIPKPIKETLFTQLMSCPLSHQLINDQNNETIISTLYQFLLISCIKNKLKIYFHFSYLDLLRKVSVADEELDFFFSYNNIIGIENALLSKSLSKPKIELSAPHCLNYKVSPFADLVKKEKKSVLKLENSCEFEKNEVFKADKVYNLWFKMKLSKKPKKRYCRYAPIYIKPLSDVDEDTKNTLIYLFICVLCLLFSVVILLKFA